MGTVHVPDMDAYRAMHERSIRDPEGFWGEVAKEFHWFTPWNKVLEWNLPDAKWFVGGTTNACFNCVDRQVESGHGDEVAILWEGEPVGAHGPEVRRITYRELRDEVARCAAALEQLGVRKGDVVTLYMGMVPELAIAALACARLGAPHSVIFGGFAAQAIVDRVQDAQSTVIVTCDGAWRRGSVVPLKANVAVVQRRKRLPELSSPFVALAASAEDEEAERCWGNTCGNPSINGGAECLALAITQAPDHKPVNANCASTQHGLGGDRDNRQDPGLVRRGPSATIWLGRREVEAPLYFVAKQQATAEAARRARRPWQKLQRRCDREHPCWPRNH